MRSYQCKPRTGRASTEESLHERVARLAVGDQGRGHCPEPNPFIARQIFAARTGSGFSASASFGFETTLASRTFARFLDDAQADGYVVHVIYVSLSNANLAVHRVRLRVERGGHDIPEETVRRRYTRSLVNFFQIYRLLADGWIMWDNSERDVELVARGGAGKTITVAAPEVWERLLQSGTSDDL